MLQRLNNLYQDHVVKNTDYAFGINQRSRSQNGKTLTILVVSESYAQGHGTAQSAITLLQNLPSHSSSYLLLAGEITNDLSFYNTTPISAHPLKHRFSTFRFLWRFAGIWSFLDRQLIQVKISRIKPDIIIVNGFGSSKLWASIRRSIPKNVKTIAISRESPRHFIEYNQSSDASKKLYTFLSGFNNIIFVSAKLRDEWTTILPPHKAYLLHNCCNEESLRDYLINNYTSKQSLRSQHELDKRSPILLSVGSIENRKGQIDLFMASEEIASFFPNFCIVCIGNYKTKKSQQFVELVRQSTYAKHFIFAGHHDIVWPWYFVSDILLFTSRAEALPRVILEAMATMLPVISTNVDGIPELIEDNKSGLLYTPGDINTLVNLVKKLTCDKEMAATIANNAYERYWHCFSSVDQKKRLEDVIKQVLS